MFAERFQVMHMNNKIRLYTIRGKLSTHTKPVLCSLKRKLQLLIRKERQKRRYHPGEEASREQRTTIFLLEPFPDAFRGIPCTYNRTSPTHVGRRLSSSRIEETTRKGNTKSQHLARRASTVTFQLCPASIRSDRQGHEQEIRS